MILLPLHTILRLLGNESKVHVFPTIVFQEMLPTRVKAHLARFRAELFLSPAESHLCWFSSYDDEIQAKMRAFLRS
jgi:hypothetical protein